MIPFSTRAARSSFASVMTVARSFAAAWFAFARWAVDVAPWKPALHPQHLAHVPAGVALDVAGGDVENEVTGRDRARRRIRRHRRRPDLDPRSRRPGPGAPPFPAQGRAVDSPVTPIARLSRRLRLGNRG